MAKALSYMVHQCMSLLNGETRPALVGPLKDATAALFHLIRAGNKAAGLTKDAILDQKDPWISCITIGPDRRKGPDMLFLDIKNGDADTSFDTIVIPMEIIDAADPTTQMQIWTVMKRITKHEEAIKDIKDRLKAEEAKLKAAKADLQVFAACSIVQALQNIDRA